MSKPTILLSLPGLRERDLPAMPKLRQLTARGAIAELVPSFPCVTCPVQANMTTGRLPDAHGVVANGFYWPQKRQVEMWTSSNECIDRPQIWDLLGHHEGGFVSAVWFPLHSKGCEADFVCTPAPIHNPDGSESLWCYTRPLNLYGELRDALGDFPLRHFWGPLAGIPSSQWIARSALFAARRWQPDFFYIYLPHLDYAAQRSGPDSPQAAAAVAELDAVLGLLAEDMPAAYQDELLWLVAGEYAISEVDHVTYPNRLLREAGLLRVREEADGEHLDLAASRAWALVDHQFAHVFTRDGSFDTAAAVAAVFRGHRGIAEVLVGPERSRYHLDHSRSGEVILISTPHSWLAYYWWLADERAPAFARTVDIHRKPGYDPVELYWDPASKGIPLRADLVRGSHGAPAHDRAQRSVILSSQPAVFPRASLADTDVFALVLRQFGVTMNA